VDPILDQQKRSEESSLPNQEGGEAGPPLLEIVAEHPDFLVVRKPAGLPCHPTKHGPWSSLAARLRWYLGSGPIHFVNRLDAETSGLVLVAKQVEVARVLRRLWERGKVKKVYWAIVHGWPEKEADIIKARIGKDETSPIAVKSSVRPDGAYAVTFYRVLQRFERSEGRFSLLELQPLTGRKHQLRVHLASIGHPIVGDKIYGIVPDAYLAMVEGRLTDEQRQRLLLPYQALVARELSFSYAAQDYRFTCAPEPWFEAFLSGEKI